MTCTIAFFPEHEHFHGALEMTLMSHPHLKNPQCLLTMLHALPEVRAANKVHALRSSNMFFNNMNMINQAKHHKNAPSVHVKPSVFAISIGPSSIMMEDVFKILLLQSSYQEGSLTEGWHISCSIRCRNSTSKSGSETGLRNL